MIDTKNTKSFNEYFLTQTKIDKGFVTLLYGDSETGKTYISCTFPEPIIFIDTEFRAINTKLLQFPNKDIRIYNPLEITEEMKDKDLDGVDIAKSIDNIAKFMTTYYKEVKEGRIVSGTLVLDSMTDIWSFIQEWGFQQLARYTEKKTGKPKADTLLQRVEQRFDWKVMNNRHSKILLMSLALKKYGIYTVYTAREEVVPDYVTGATETRHIRVQKDLPFRSDVRFRLENAIYKGKIAHLAHCKKLLTYDPDPYPIKNLTFEKIIDIINNKGVITERLRV